MWSVALPASAASKVKMWRVRGEVEASGSAASLTSGPSSVPVWLCCRAVPLMEIDVPACTKTGLSAGSAPGVKRNSLPAPVRSVKVASWE